MLPFASNKILGVHVTIGCIWHDTKRSAYEGLPGKAAPGSEYKPPNYSADVQYPCFRTSHLKTRHLVAVY
ncbi:MAG: hypothetical protein COA78_00590 [Blastopirellula sp.]|nr:MAG: hypothetical protein COA78_00590 [Blastopirellula sp.]